MKFAFAITGSPNSGVQQQDRSRFGAPQSTGTEFIPAWTVVTLPAAQGSKPCVQYCAVSSISSCGGRMTDASYPPTAM